MIISIPYTISGANPPFNFSVKDETNVERFLYIQSNKIFFNYSSAGNYIIKVIKNDCILEQTKYINCGIEDINICNSFNISLVSVQGYNININISNPNNNCIDYEYQYSQDINFNSFSILETSNCVSNKSLLFPFTGLYYLRVKTKCSNNENNLSNIISLNINSQNSCYLYAGCTGSGNDPNYDTFRIVLSNPLNDNINFVLSNGSVMTILKGTTIQEQIIEITEGCPTIVSNSLNLNFCN